MATASAGIYRPRQPERTVLYRVVAQHFERFVQVYDERFARTRGPLPPGAQEAVNTQAPVARWDVYELIGRVLE
jgi:hypothetical protein